MLTVTEKFFDFKNIFKYLLNDVSAYSGNAIGGIYAQYLAKTYSEISQNVDSNRIFLLNCYYNCQIFCLEWHEVNNYFDEV